MSLETTLTDEQKSKIAKHNVRKFLKSSLISPETGKAFVNVTTKDELTILVSSLEILGYRASGVGLIQAKDARDAREREYCYDAGDFRPKGETIQDPEFCHGQPKTSYSADDYSGKVDTRLDKVSNFPTTIEMDANIVVAELISPDKSKSNASKESWTLRN